MLEVGNKYRIFVYGTQSETKWQTVVIMYADAVKDQLKFIPMII